MPEEMNEVLPLSSKIRMQYIYISLTMTMSKRKTTNDACVNTEIVEFLQFRFLHLEILMLILKFK